MAYDSTRGVTVLFGGYDDDGRLGDIGCFINLLFFKLRMLSLGTSVYLTYSDMLSYKSSILTICRL